MKSTRNQASRPLQWRTLGSGLLALSLLFTGVSASANTMDLVTTSIGSLETSPDLNVTGGDAAARPHTTLIAPDLTVCDERNHMIMRINTAGDLQVCKVTGAVDAWAWQTHQLVGSNIANNAVNTDHIAANEVEAADLASGAVTTANLGNSAVGNAQVANNAVSTAKLQNSSVTAPKLGFPRPPQQTRGTPTPTPPPAPTPPAPTAPKPPPAPTPTPEPPPSWEPPPVPEEPPTKVPDTTPPEPVCTEIPGVEYTYQSCKNWSANYCRYGHFVSGQGDNCFLGIGTRCKDVPVHYYISSDRWCGEYYRDSTDEGQRDTGAWIRSEIDCLSYKEHTGTRPATLSCN